MSLTRKTLFASCLVLTFTAWFGLSGAEERGIEERGAEKQRGVETATFSMYCYWTGEATLGRIDGVVASRIGHWGGDEIVQVDYDPSRTEVDELVKALKGQRSFYALVVDSDRERQATLRDNGRLAVTVHSGKPHFIQPKHSLRTRHPEIFALDLSEEQAITLNSWSYFGGKMPDVLTDAQKARLPR